MNDVQFGQMVEALNRIDSSVKEVKETLAQLPCQKQGERIASLETRTKWHERVGGTFFGIIGGVLGLR